MQANILTEFDPNVYRRFGLPTAEHLLVLRVDEVYWESLHKKLKAHVEKNDKRIMSGMEPFKLEVKIGVDYRHRSLSANAWLWAMHTVESAIINGGGGTWHGLTDVTPEMIHEDYMDRFAPRAEVVVDEWMVRALGETARIVSQETLPDGRVKLSLMKTSSYMNVREFAQLAHEVETQIESYGVPLDAYSDFKKLQGQIPEFDKKSAEGAKELIPDADVVSVQSSANGNSIVTMEKPWHRMTDDEKLKADPARYDEEKQMPLF